MNEPACMLLFGSQPICVVVGVRNLFGHGRRRLLIDLASSVKRAMRFKSGFRDHDWSGTPFMILIPIPEEGDDGAPSLLFFAIFIPFGAPLGKFSLGICCCTRLRN